MKRQTLRVIVDAYEFEKSMSDIQRAAHFLDYLARKAPYQLCPPSLAFKAITGYARLPDDRSDQVVKFRKKGSAIRKTLGKAYGRGLVVQRPLSHMRATVDGQDTADTQLRRQMRGVECAVIAAGKTEDMIKPSEVRRKETREWLRLGVKPLLDALEKDRRWLPPKPKDEDEEESP